MNKTPNLFTYSESRELPFRCRQELVLTESIFKEETQLNNISHKFMTDHLQNKLTDPIEIEKTFQYLQKS